MKFPAAACVLVTFLGVSCQSPQKVLEHRPNILWISIEDTSPRLGCYGDPIARTPNLDRLAAEGVRYTQAFTTAGVCAPSRSAIITGMFQTSIGTHHMRTTHRGPGLPTPYFAVPPPYVKGFPEYLRASGYYCTNRRKTDYQFGEPITIWDDCSETAHWRNRRPGQPFFAVFNFTVTHESKDWPKEGEVLETDPASVMVPPYYPDTPKVREAIARHYDNLQRADAMAGEILRQLEEDGLAENTVVFFWSDHGDGFPRAKRWLYDAGIHVPLIIRWPGHLPAGSTDDRLISLMDLAPTVLSIAGVPIPQHIQGRAFLGEQAARPREYVFAARDRIDESYDFVRAVRDRRYKYIRNFYPDKPYILPVPYRDRHPIMQEIYRLRDAGRLTGPQLWFVQNQRPTEELYDLDRDPWEIDNRIDDPDLANVAERLRRRLDEFMNEIGDLGSLPEAEMVAQMWPGGEQPVTARPTMDPPGGSFTKPVTVSLSCPTEGASIAYTFASGENPHWELYSAPLQLAKSCTLRAVAIRYGYKQSPEVRMRFEITAGEEKEER
ncbi:MAG: sulfatase-like hydrolase/transferase [Acidobacteriota bacterium]